MENVNITEMTKPSLKKFLNQNLDLDGLEKFVSKVNAIFDEIKESKEQEKAEELKKQELLQATLKQLEEQGISVDEIMSASTKPSGKKAVRKPVANKYKITVDGVEHGWSGRGITPKVFSEYMEKNGIGKDQLPSA